jgi:CheY-like chemotaxis protein
MAQEKDTREDTKNIGRQKIETRKPSRIACVADALVRRVMKSGYPGEVRNRFILQGKLAGGFTPKMGIDETRFNESLFLTKLLVESEMVCASALDSPREAEEVLRLAASSLEITRRLEDKQMNQTALAIPQTALGNPLAEIMHILMVEDSPEDADLLREMLLEASSEQLQFTHSKRLGEAIERLSEERFDAMLLDLLLPDSQGDETLDRIMAQDVDLPVLVLTGLEDEMLGFRSLQMGAQDYLIKGQMDGNLLLRAIRYAIERKRLENRLRERHEKVAAERGAKAGILSNLSHEFRTLLTPIIGFSEVLVQKYLGELNKEQVEYMKEILVCGKSLLALVNDNISILEIEDGRMETCSLLGHPPR